METLREQLHLSLSDEDDGARFAGAGFGFRARGFGAGFSVIQEKKVVKITQQDCEQ